MVMDSLWSLFKGVFDGVVGFIPRKEYPSIMLYWNESRFISIPNLFLIAF